ncbi:MAG: hypothetical protein A2Y62_14930 [Candidatus Fischerbacteria bacterium RBG_13_37_8]|uniref:Uncharacterized protein n=1 Tax=Candidatus Fischerbacteria bacterium RBG_13_37_8 TaxID=1817863 RepID=A0A1F5V4P9_9BACT|nr:MAG: hypothetical protein A2Y62_14930 [Candidatus Fischerbacteria bacterium RBG_13_37_8]
MSRWEIRCAHCSQVFEAGKAVWCKCSYQFPTKICPYCLKCYCSNREAFIYFWENVPAGERRGAILVGTKKEISEWLKRVGLLDDDEVRDIMQESQALKAGFLKAAFKLGYFSKEEAEQIKRIMHYTPVHLIKGAEDSLQSREIWHEHSGIIIERVQFHNQQYYVVAFPFGSGQTGVHRMQERLKAMVIPVYVELRTWKMIAESVSSGDVEPQRVIEPAYSLKEWFERIIDEVIESGREELLVAPDAQFQDKSNIFFLHDRGWTLHSIAPFAYSSLVWSLTNIIPEEGKACKGNYYLKRGMIDGKVFLTLQPFHWISTYEESIGLQVLINLMRFQTGLVIVKAGIFAETLGRTLVAMAEMGKYSVGVNCNSIKGENTILFNLSSVKGSTFFKYICIIKKEQDLEEASRISASHFVIAIINEEMYVQQVVESNPRVVKVMIFWRFRKLCSRCRIKREEAYFKKKFLAVWERNPEGCQACGMRGVKGELLFFIEREQIDESTLRGLIESGEIDWRDVSHYNPRCIMEFTGINNMFMRTNNMVEKHGG